MIIVETNKLRKSRNFFIKKINFNNSKYILLVNDAK